MDKPSYPMPTELEPLAEIHPRPLQPLAIPSKLSDLPPLPSKPRASLLDHAYTLTTHLVPAAYPRITPDVPDPKLPVFSTDKAKFKASVDESVQEVLGTREKQWSGELKGEGSRVQLWNCVNRYVKKDQKPNGAKAGEKSLTLFFAHANGFPKEIWEPTLRDVIAQNARLPSPLDIQEIWLWEAVNHGDAALVNAGKLGGIYDWADNTRDILNFLLSYLPSSPFAPTLPIHLQRLPESIAQSRRTFGYSARTLVTVGHSFGGCTSYLAALNVPVLFSSIILVDPIIRPLRPGRPLILREHHEKMTMDAIRRRGHWASRHEALKSFRTSPFFGVWNPDALDLYVNCGLYDDPQGGVRLKMPGILEAIVFSEALTTYETWFLAPKLDERIQLKWIMPGQIPPEEIRMKQELVWRRPARSTNVIIPSAGHLIPQEAPHELAQEILDFLAPKHSSPSAHAKL